MGVLDPMGQIEFVCNMLAEGVSLAGASSQFMVRVMGYPGRDSTKKVAIYQSKECDNTTNLLKKP